MSIDLNFSEPTLDSVKMPLAFDQRVCEGPFKLMQRVLALLFKDHATALTSTLGTDILNLAQIGNALEQSELQNQFHIALDRVKEALDTYSPATLPDNEKALDLEATVNITEDPTAVEVEITVTTVSGDVASSKLPVTLTGEN